MRPPFAFALCLILLADDARASPQPRQDDNLITTRHNHNHNRNQTIRGVWDFVGNWIQNSEWFPIQISIPETLGSIGNGISGIIQRLPFFNAQQQQGSSTRPMILWVRRQPNVTAMHELFDDELPYP